MYPLYVFKRQPASAIKRNNAFAFARSRLQRFHSGEPVCGAVQRPAVCVSKMYAAQIKVMLHTVIFLY